MKNETRRNQFKSKFLGNNTIILLVAICLAFCILVSIHTIFNNENVYAEENETQQRQIVNFNQYIENSYVNYSSVVVGFNSNQITFGYVLAPNHIFYVKYNVRVSGNNAVEFGFRPNGENNSRTDTLNANNSRVDYVITNVNKYSCIFAYTNGTDTRINCMCVDLTQMFGDNIPTLEECRNIFISEYYYYNTGSEIYLDSLESYSRGYTAGFNSAWESQNVSYKQFVIGAQSFAFNNQQYTEESTKSYDAVAGAYSFGGILGIPLGFTSIGGTNYEIDFTLLCTDWAGESLSFKQEYSLYFYYIDSDNNLIQIGKIPYYEISGNYGTYKGSFVCPVDTDTIYLEFTTKPLDNTPTIATAFASNITFRSQNIESAINSAFNSGAESVKESYLPGGDLYNSIYNLGYSNGIASNKPFTDSWDFIGQSFHGIGEILAMELIPGLPLGLFVALPLLVGLLFFIVKIAKGSGG